MKLYSYWQSTTSYRIRAALNLKQMAYETVPVDLSTDVQHMPAYRALNAGSGVPTLVLDDGTVLTQSMAILDYVDAVGPGPRLTPLDPVTRAQVMAVAHTVATDIHPVNNLRVIGQLKSRFGVTPEQTRDWMCHWMTEGFATLEAMIPEGDSFAFGDAPTLADICVTAQVYNAHRWGVDLTKFPKAVRIERHCLTLSGFADAHPDTQPDAKVSA